MRILFVGTTKFGLKCLKELSTTRDVEIAGVVTGKKKFKISYSDTPVTNVLYANYIPYCSKNSIPHYTVKNNMKEKSLEQFIQQCRAEFALVVGWYYMIPQKLLSLMPFAGLHASLLPKYSGGAPVVWSMINGEDKTGITFFFFEAGVDNGPIIGQKTVKIGQKDTIKSLYAKIETAGISLLKTYLPKIMDKSVTSYPQDESKRTIYPQRKPQDGLIDWGWSVTKISNFIRAQTKPYPGAYTVINKKKIIIWDADVYET